MHKLYAFIATIALVGTSTAQDFAFDRGAFIIGGSAMASFSSGDLFENGDGDGSTQFGISPQVLYFVSPGLGIGGTLTLGGTKQGDVGTTSIGLAPEFAYFFGDPDGGTFPFVSVAPGFMTRKTNGRIEDYTTNGLSMVVTGGVAILVGRSASVTIGAYYQYQQFKIDEFDDSRSGNIIGVKAGVQVHVF